MKRIIWFSSFAILSFFCCLSAVWLGVPVNSCLIFWLYQVFLVFLPGALLLCILFSGREFSPLNALLFAFSIGYAVNILLYFFAACLGPNRVNMTISLLVATGGLVAAFLWKKPVVIISYKRAEWFYSALFLLLLVIVFFNYSGSPLPSENNPSTYYHQDALYWIENAVSLKLSFPPEELRYSGMRLFYHYFASVYVAVASLVTGINCYSIGYSLYGLCRSLVLFGGLYAAAQAFLKDSRLRKLFMISILFTTGIEKYTLMKYVNQLIYLPFGFDLAVGYGAYTLALFCSQQKKASFDWKLLILSAVAMFMCVGHKAPVACVYMVFAGVMCVWWLHERAYKKSMVYGAAMISVFAVVLVVCIGVLSPGESRVNTGSFSLTASLKNSHYFEVLHAYRRLSQAGSLYEKIISVLTWFAAMILFLLSIHPYMWFLDFCGIFLLIRRRRVDVLDSALLLSMIAGTAVGIFNEQDGMSQMYYCLAAFLPGILFGVKNVEIDAKRRNLKLVFTAFTVLFLLSGVKNYFVDAGIISTTEYVFNKMFLYADTSLPGSPEEGYPPNSIQFSDYQALCWLRDNTPHDAILVSDRDIRLEQRVYMCHGAFSERQMYLEGDVYLYSAYQNEREARRDRIRWLYLNDMDALKKAKDDGVDYIIQTKWIKPEYQGQGCTLVFENETVRIWKVL